MTTCAECRFSRPSCVDDYLECHRYPPTDGWPKVQCKQWCGEWKDKDHDYMRGFKDGLERGRYEEMTQEDVKS